MELILYLSEKENLLSPTVKSIGKLFSLLEKRLTGAEYTIVKKMTYRQPCTDSPIKRQGLCG